MVTEDKRGRAAAVEVDHEGDQEDLQEAEERDRRHMELLAGLQGGSVGITRLSALQDSGVRATSGLTVCSPGTRARRPGGAHKAKSRFARQLRFDRGLYSKTGTRPHAV